MKAIKRKMTCLLVLFLVVICVFFSTQTKVKAETTTNVNVENDLCQMSINTTNNVPFLADESVSKRWYSCELVCDAGDDYSGYSRDARPVYYPKNGTYDPINAEKFIVYATDNTNVEKKLSPVDNLQSPANINANGQVSIRIMAKNNYAPTAHNHNDIKLFGSIDKYIRPTNASGFVGYGKIIYRSVDIGTTSWDRSNWKYLDLQDGLSFNVGVNQHVQIVVIHEVEETGNAFQLNYFTELKGIYRFDTYA